MINDKKILGIIPARGKSKRLPNKNVLPINDKPLIAWTIEAALASKYIDRVVVSTDDKKIAEMSLKLGADIPFMRPKKLATDKSSSVDVVLHLLEKLEENGEFYDFIILLQPTSPLRTVQNIDESIELLESKNVDGVISVCEVNHSPLWCNIIPEDGDLSNFLDEEISKKRSQDLEQYYRLNGAIYICDTKRLKDERVFFIRSKCLAYKMPQEQSVDIDTKFDFMQAEFLFNLLND